MYLGCPPHPAIQSPLVGRDSTPSALGAPAWAPELFSKTQACADSCEFLGRFQGVNTSGTTIHFSYNFTIDGKNAVAFLRQKMKLQSGGREKTRVRKKKPEMGREKWMSMQRRWVRKRVTDLLFPRPNPFRSTLGTSQARS